MIHSLKRILNTLLYDAFLYLPDPLLYSVLSVLGYLRSFYRIFVDFNMDVELYEGYTKGHPVRILWVGTREMKGYVLERLYGSDYRVTTLKSLNFINLGLKLENLLSTRPDLIYVEMNRLLPPLRGYKRIKQVVRTKMKIEEYHLTRNHRKIMRIVGENGVALKHFKVSKHLHKLRLFYDQLYAPHTSSRWGRGRVESFDRMKRFHAKGILFLAYLRGEAIAGGLLLCQRETLVFCKYGVRNAADRVNRAAASIYNHITFAKDNKFRCFDAFHVKPFLNDGVLRHKRSCGLSLQREKQGYYRDQDVYLRVLNYNPGVVDFLNENPFVFVSHGNLVASLLCVDGKTASLADEITRQYRSYRTGGIVRYEFYLNRELTDDEKREVYERCRLTEAENILKFRNVKFHATKEEVLIKSGT